MGDIEQIVSTSQPSETSNPRTRNRPPSNSAEPRSNEQRGPPPNWRTNIKSSVKLDICRKYYIAGFFLLPIFWLVNFIWHYRDAYQEETFEEQPQIKSYVIKSGIGFLIWAVLLTFWVIYFQTQRSYHDWDYLTFNFPTGSA